MGNALAIPILLGIAITALAGVLSPGDLLAGQLKAPSACTPVASESALAAALQAGTPCISITASFPLTQEHAITTPLQTVLCRPGTALTFGFPVGGKRGFIIPQGVQGVRIGSCTFSGEFDGAITNGGTFTSLHDNRFLSTIAGIREPLTAVDGYYQRNTFKSSKDAGMVLHGEGASVIESSFTNNPTGLRIGMPPAEAAGQPNAVCSVVAPSICSVPGAGKGVLVDSSTFTANSKGVHLAGLDGTVQESTFTQNGIGIDVQAVVLDNVMPDPSNPSWIIPAQISGADLLDNTLSQNIYAGIRLYGPSMPFWYLPFQYHRISKILDNTMTGNKYGFLIETDDQSSYFHTSWEEYTILWYGTITDSNEDGIFIRNGGAWTDVAWSTIENNQASGIHLGDGGNKRGQLNYIYSNSIKNNGKYGIIYETGGSFVTALNEIDSNKKGIYLSPITDFQTTYNSQIALVCNDISFNQEEGIAVDNTIQSTQTGYPLITRYVWQNRIVSNGLDGVNILSPPFDPFYSSWWLSYSGGVARIENHFIGNEITANARDGLHFDGPHGMFVGLNNIYGNTNQNIVDTGNSNYQNNMYDEAQYKDAFNYYHGQCNVQCSQNVDCGTYGSCVSGTCQCNTGTCQADNTCNSYPQYALHYGNFNQFEGNYPNYPPDFVINNNAPPLQTCTQDSDCMYRNCYDPTSSGSGVCADVDEITSQSPFTGFWPACQFPYSLPPYCGDGVVQSWLGEECENSAQCPAGQVCQSCKCVGTSPFPTPIGDVFPFTPPLPPDSVKEPLSGPPDEGLSPQEKEYRKQVEQQLFEELEISLKVSQ